MVMDAPAQEALKDRVCAEVDRLAGVLVDVSHQLHDHPELAFEEHRAHELLTGVLDRAGLPVARGYLDLPTAFRAEAGAGGPTVAVLCEYDALPEIGHACGHNIIAAAGLGAALAAATVAEAAGGRVVVLGTPAEEGGGGKVLLADRGAFAGVDAAMMVHPAGHDLVRMDCIAIDQLEATYRGRAAHAAAAPWQGRNALDAAVLGYLNVAALRQHIRPDERVHGIFTKAGDKPNVVPQEAASFWYVRSGTLASLGPLRERVLACLQAGADAAGCEMTWGTSAPAYSDLLDSWPLVEAYVGNAGRLGREVRDPRTTGTPVLGSTDMGNVSYLVPSIHPMIQVSPPGVAIHTPEFAVHAGSAAGDRAVLDGAKAMAMTVVDLWTDPALLAAARTQHAAAVAAAGLAAQGGS